MYDRDWETSTAASLEDIVYIRDIVKNTAEFYASRLVDYIKNNSASYPEYNSNSGGDISPTKEAYFSGMNLASYNQSMLNTRITINDFLTSDISAS